MNRAEFMKELEYLLQDIPEEDKEEALAYYRDYLEEAGDENEAQVIREFGSPERVAAIIRSDLIGGLEDGGAFTEAGYQDERFRDPNFQVAERRDLPEAHEPNLGGAAGAGGTGSGQRRPAPKDDWVKWLLKVGALLVLLAVAAPILLGIGGSALGLAAGLLALVIGIVICIGVLTIGTCIGAVALLVLGVIVLITNPAGGILILGLGVLALGLALIGVALSVLVYGRFLPYCIRGIVNGISGLLHGKRRGQA